MRIEVIAIDDYSAAVLTVFNNIFQREEISYGIFRSYFSVFSYRLFTHIVLLAHTPNRAKIASIFAKTLAGQSVKIPSDRQGAPNAIAAACKVELGR